MAKLELGRETIDSPDWGSSTKISLNSYYLSKVNIKNYYFKTFKHSEYHHAKTSEKKFFFWFFFLFGYNFFFWKIYKILTWFMVSHKSQRVRNKKRKRISENWIFSKKNIVHIKLLESRLPFSPIFTIVWVSHDDKISEKTLKLLKKG